MLLARTPIVLIRFCFQTLPVQSSRFGDHLLGCGQGNWRTWCHEVLCDVILHALPVDSANHRKEQRCSSDNSMRPCDVFHSDFEQGLPTYFDATVRNSLQPLNNVQAACPAGVTAEAGENEKDSGPETLVAATGSVCHLHPSDSGHHIVKAIARRLDFHGNLSISKATTNIREQLSVKLWLSLYVKYI